MRLEQFQEYPRCENKQYTATDRKERGCGPYHEHVLRTPAPLHLGRRRLWRWGRLRWRLFGWFSRAPGNLMRRRADGLYPTGLFIECKPFDHAIVELDTYHLDSIDHAGLHFDNVIQ